MFSVYPSTFNLLKQLVYLFGGCLASTCINKAKKLNWNSFLPLKKLIVEIKEMQHILIDATYKVN